MKSFEDMIAERQAQVHQRREEQATQNQENQRRDQQAASEQQRIQESKRPVQQKLAYEIRHDAQRAAELYTELDLDFDWVVSVSQKESPDRGLLQNLIAPPQSPQYEMLTGKLLSITSKFSHITKEYGYKGESSRDTYFYKVEGCVLGADGNIYTIDTLSGAGHLAASYLRSARSPKKVVEQLNEPYPQLNLSPLTPATDDELFPLEKIELKGIGYDTGHLIKWRELFLEAGGLTT